MDLYEKSWALYKAHTEHFLEDVESYADFCGSRRSLELFAGYGRVANPLTAAGVDLETVELSPSFARFIDLPRSKNHVCGVLDFRPRRKFERVFAAYNSFCLLSGPGDAERFFGLLRDWLTDDGVASLNYYSARHWKDAAGGDFLFEGRRVRYEPKWDLSRREDSVGRWIDEYRLDGATVSHDYAVRLYEDRDALSGLLAQAGLRLKAVEEPEPGWLDFLITIAGIEESRG